jgi:hypothetical protein
VVRKFCGDDGRSGAPGESAPDDVPLLLGLDGELGELSELPPPAPRLAAPPPVEPPPAEPPDDPPPEELPPDCASAATGAIANAAATRHADKRTMTDLLRTQNSPAQKAVPLPQPGP